MVHHAYAISQKLSTRADGSIRLPELGFGRVMRVDRRQTGGLTTPNRAPPQRKELMMPQKKPGRLFVLTVLVRAALAALSLSGIAHAQSISKAAPPQPSGGTYGLTTGGNFTTGDSG
jgi:hypothetical protein